MNERAIFAAALDLADPAERAAYLDNACAGNAELRQHLDDLLAAQDKLGSFLNEPHQRPVPTIDYAPIAEKPGTKIGPYILREQIGEGGFGLVFVAEQTDPVKRKVALKIIKPGMDSRQVILRFEAERQALAMMDHPNIAKVLDAGATESGRPYFVMELVRGIPITEYCDKNQLSPKERLDLFVTVCQAIQHAHQKGIVHRDVKPSNVLVTSHDGKPVAKVIDFGVAKAIHQQLTSHTIYTNFAQMIGTPLYMSPEQAEMSGLDIDTRSDIYSLGVLLYELLTGTTPIDRKKFAKAAYDEIRRMIREEEPPKPSTRLSSTESIASIAASRHTEPAKLSKLVRGDLDWITMKCLEKDRTRRYETANGLARDIQRYLSDEPVEACPPSATYRLRKFAKKNRAALTTAAAIAFLLVGGIAVSAWQAVRASQAEAAALAALDEKEKARAAEAEQRRRAEVNEQRAKSEEQNARQQEAETKAVLDFVENKVFAAARPKEQDGGLGREVSLAEAIKQALPFVEKSFPDQPLIEARLRMTLGLSFSYLGAADVAEAQYARARQLYEARFGSDHPNTLASMNNLANSYTELGRHAEALELHEETLQHRKAKLGPDHPDTLKSMGNLAGSYADLGRHAEAIKLLEETLQLQKARLGPDHPDTLKSRNNLAHGYADLGRHAEALKLLVETLPLMKARLGPDHPDTLMSMMGLANGYADLGRHAEALELLEEMLPLMKAKLGPDHPHTLSSAHNLASSYATLGRHAEALELLEATLPLMKAKLGSDHPYTLTGMNSLAISYSVLGRHAEALKLHEEALPHLKAKLGPEHPYTLGSMVNLASSYHALGRLADAVGHYEAALAIMKLKIPNHQFTSNCMNGLARSYVALGRHAEALKLREETLQLQKAKLGPDHPDTTRTIYDVACLHALMIARAEDRGKQADLAMNWLWQAVAAGYKDAEQMKKDKDLDALREREDFKKLIAELESKANKK